MVGAWVNYFGSNWVSPEKKTSHLCVILHQLLHAPWLRRLAMAKAKMQRGFLWKLIFHSLATFCFSKLFVTSISPPWHRQHTPSQFDAPLQSCLAGQLLFWDKNEDQADPGKVFFSKVPNLDSSSPLTSQGSSRSSKPKSLTRSRLLGLNFIIELWLRQNLFWKSLWQPFHQPEHPHPPAAKTTSHLIIGQLVALFTLCKQIAHLAQSAPVIFQPSYNSCHHLQAGHRNQT